MNQILIRKAVRIQFPDEAEPMERMLGLIARHQINVELLQATSSVDGGSITLVTDGNRKALEVWSQEGLNVTEVNLLGLQLPNQPGKLATLLRRLEPKGVCMRYLSVTGREAGTSSVLMSTTNDFKAVQLLTSTNGSSGVATPSPRLFAYSNGLPTQPYRKERLL